MAFPQFIFLYRIGNHNYTDWSSWTPCSVTCGDGAESRTRYCLDESGSGCVGSAVETKSCLKEPCTSKILEAENFFPFFET